MSAIDAIAEYARLVMDDCMLEFNDAELRQEIVDDISEYVNDLARTDLYKIDAYNVICDESNNTPAVINNNQLCVTITVVENGVRSIRKLRVP
jgi:hypothetical protein